MSKHISDELRIKLEENGLRTSDPNSISGLAPQEKLGVNIRVKSVLLEYQFRSIERTFCYVCGQSKHYRGFVFSLFDDTRILVGNCCAKKIANKDLLNAAIQRFETSKNAVSFEVAARSKIEIIPELVEEIDLLKHYCDQIDEVSEKVQRLLFSHKKEVIANARENNGRLVIARRVRNSAKEAARAKHDTTNFEAMSFEKVFEQPVFGLGFLSKKKRTDLIRYNILIQLNSLQKRVNYNSKNRISSTEFLALFRTQIRDAYDELNEILDDAGLFLSEANLKTIDRFIRFQSLSTDSIRNGGVAATGHFYRETCTMKENLPRRPHLVNFDTQVLNKSSAKK